MGSDDAPDIQEFLDASTREPAGVWSDAREDIVGGRCVFCKVPQEDMEVETWSIHETGEVICDQCLGDLRTYKRTRDYMQFMDAALKDYEELKAQLQAHDEQLAAIVASYFAGQVEAEHHELRESHGGVNDD